MVFNQEDSSISEDVTVIHTEAQSRGRKKKTSRHLRITLKMLKNLKTKTLQINKLVKLLWNLTKV
jgi:hypothetical protein